MVYAGEWLVEAERPTVVLCAECGRRMGVEAVGVVLRYGRYAGHFHGDRYRCRGCGAAVFTGLGWECFGPCRVEVDFTSR